MGFRNPFDAPPIRAHALPGEADPTGELADPKSDPLEDSEASPPAPAGEVLPVEFLGQSAEYARLWYVNLFLTLITAGLYSPWAKVSQRTYLTSRTLIGGQPIVYHARPLPILKGRLLAAALVAMAWGLITLLPSAKALVLTGAILVAPWFLLATFSFNAANHSWRGIHFGFSGCWRDASLATLPLLLWPALLLTSEQVSTADDGLALLFALGPALGYLLAWPYTMAAMTRLRASGFHFGTAKAELAASVSDFYALYFKGMGPRFLGLMMIAGFIAGLATALGTADVLVLAKLIVTAVTAALVTGYARGRRLNLTLHRLTLGGRIRFRSSLTPEQLAVLYLINLCWLVGTLGLAAPWRRIATIRARCRNITVYVDGALDDIACAGPPSRGALGESVAEVLNLDLSL